MSRLTERYIQNKSLEFLKSYYSEKYHPENIYGKKEVRTVGGLRADGLLCFDSEKQREHTVSLEAKSHKTLGNILVYWNDDKLSIDATFFSIPLGLSTIFFLWTFHWYWILIVTLLSILFLWVLIVFVIGLLEPVHYKLSDVILQVKKYPANEQWIAISKDTFNLARNKKSNFFKKDNPESFLQTCWNKNVGVLIVTRKRIEVMFDPKFRRGNFLENYCTAEKIRGKLAVRLIF